MSITIFKVHTEHNHKHRNTNIPIWKTNQTTNFNCGSAYRAPNLNIEEYKEQQLQLLKYRQYKQRHCTDRAPTETFELQT